jgi:hypothetical protein
MKRRILILILTVNEEVCKFHQQKRKNILSFRHLDFREKVPPVVQTASTIVISLIVTKYVSKCMCVMHFLLLFIYSQNTYVDLWNRYPNARPVTSL